MATYLVNEIRSILENLVEMNVNVPQFLIAGLEITQKLIDNQTEIKKEEKNRNE
ncbi:MAG: phage holin family protein [Roseburia sp.]|nr:phage holin family protein [Roseburia sp.]